MKATGLIFLHILTGVTISHADITTGLIGEWLFNGNPSDSSGNNLNGIVSGATLTTDRFGIANSAYRFAPSVNSQITIADNPLLNFTSEFSVSYWAKFDQPWTYHLESLIWKFDHATLQGWHLGVNQDDSMYGASNFAIKFDVPSGGASIPTASETVSYSMLSSWHHVVGVFGSSTLELYLDGTLVDTVSGPPSILAASHDLVFGGSENPVSGAYSRNLDDVRIYNRALNGSDVIELHALPEPTSALFATLGAAILATRRNRASSPQRN